MPTNNSIGLNQPGYAVYDGNGTFFGRSIIPANPSVVVSNGSGIGGNTSIAVVALGMSFVDATAATQTMATNTSYSANRTGGVAFTLPATANPGDVMEIDGRLGIWTIIQGAGQQIVCQDIATTLGVSGIVTAKKQTDGIILKCIVGGTSTIWRVIASQGNPDFS